MKAYITFGQVHTHSIDGKTLDKDCVAVIEAFGFENCRKLAFDMFGQRWSNISSQVQNMEFYPRGFIDLT